MAVDKRVMFLVVLTFLWTTNWGDAEVCVLMKSCILPCSFQSGAEAVIHWIKVNGNLPVHSFYHNQDQLARQSQDFRGRTSLFKTQISRGNASMQLAKVEIRDEGKYKCYTSTISGNKESFIDLYVEAPVRKVDIQQVGNGITCSSDGIYPQPELTWSTNPPSSLTPPDTPTVERTEQQLYNIRSSLILSDGVPDLVYICTVSARNKRKAILLSPSSMSGCKTETTITCTSSNTNRTSLIWRFNHSQIILSQTGANSAYTASEGWSQHVEGLSESGSLTLKDLSSDQEGIYTCELSNEAETYLNTTTLETIKDCSAVSGAAVGVGVAFLVILPILGLVVFFLYRKKKLCWKKPPEVSAKTGPDSPDSEPLKSVSCDGSDKDKDEGT